MKQMDGHTTNKRTNEREHAGNECAAIFLCNKHIKHINDMSQIHVMNNMNIILCSCKPNDEQNYEN